MILNESRVYVIRKDDKAAMDLMRKLCRKPVKPGQVIPLDDDEFEIVKNSFVEIKLDED